MDIVRWDDMAEPDQVRAAVEWIFFEASGTKTFASGAARAAFCERWLGRYFAHDPDHVFVAVDRSGGVVGYLVGSFDDPARAARFSDIGYFADFSALTARYPAHLHVNLSERARGEGVGGRLVEAFCASVRGAGVAGVHVVTGQGVRNVGFYERLGFYERGATTFNGHGIVFLGRDLA